MHLLRVCFQKKMKIKIIIPKHPKKDKWTISIKNSQYKRANVTSVYRFVEGKVNVFLRSRERKKVMIVVDYDQLHGLPTGHDPEWFNDITSDSRDELLYTLTCFLEDHLTMEYAKVRYEQYGGNYL